MPQRVAVNCRNGPEYIIEFFQKTFQCHKNFNVSHFKAELYRYIYIVIFGKHLPELYWIVLICF